MILNFASILLPIRDIKQNQIMFCWYKFRQFDQSYIYIYIYIYIYKYVCILEGDPACLVCFVCQTGVGMRGIIVLLEKLMSRQIQFGNTWCKISF